MNKELTPLEALKYLIKNKRKHWLDGDKSNECLEIIETALKDYEKQHQIDIDLLGTAYKTNIQNQKKLKALEIIKDKNVKIDVLKYQSDVVFYNMAVFEKEEKLTQEEFDLLKGVLL